MPGIIGGTSLYDLPGLGDVAKNDETGRSVMTAVANAGLPACSGGCATAAAQAITTQTEHITEEIQNRLSIILSITPV